MSNHWCILYTNGVEIEAIHFITCGNILLTAVGQDVCRPPMVSFGVHREELKDGWLHSTGGMVNETRMLEVDYFDNRIDQFEFNSQGWVDMTTISENSRKLKYRHKVPINFGEYTISQDSTDYEVCL